MPPLGRYCAESLAISRVLCTTSWPALDIAEASAVLLAGGACEYWLGSFTFFSEVSSPGVFTNALGCLLYAGAAYLSELSI